MQRHGFNMMALCLMTFLSSFFLPPFSKQEKKHMGHCQHNSTTPPTLNLQVFVELNGLKKASTAEVRRDWKNMASRNKQTYIIRSVLEVRMYSVASMVTLLAGLVFKYRLDLCRLVIGSIPSNKRTLTCLRYPGGACKGSMKTAPSG